MSEAGSAKQSATGFVPIRKWNDAAARVQRCNTWRAIEYESAFARRDRLYFIAHKIKMNDKQGSGNNRLRAGQYGRTC
jgi:hypothetical protein